MICGMAMRMIPLALPAISNATGWVASCRAVCYNNVERQRVYRRHIAQVVMHRLYSFVVESIGGVLIKHHYIETLL